MRWLVFLILLAGCRQAPATVSAVDRYEIAIELAPDGSAIVRESITVNRDGGMPGRLRRAIAGDRADGFENAAAATDGSSAGTRVEADSSLDITWDIAAGGRRSAVLEARYRALGVVEIQGMRGTFMWPVLPTDRQFETGAATISLKLPAGTRVLEPPNIDSPGWDWNRVDGELVGNKSNIAPAEPAVVAIGLALDAVPMLEPRWQRRALLGRELTPAFIAAALFIVVTAGGILYAIRVQYFRTTIAADAARGPEVARGLRMTGIVVIIFGVVCAAFVYAILRPLGPWTQAVPASIVLVGLWFVLVGAWYSSRSSH